MAKALKCDRCGRFYVLLSEIRNYRIRDFSEPYKNEKYVDLCPDCYEKLCDFLDGAWKSIGMKPKETVGTEELHPEEWDNSYYDEFEEDSE